MANKEEEPTTNNRVQYAEDVEIRPRARRTRRDSTDSLSIRSVRSFSRQRIEPGSMLPIEYRTISYNIEEFKTRQSSIPDKSQNPSKVDRLDSAAIEFTDLDWHKVYQNALFLSSKY